MHGFALRSAMIKLKQKMESKMKTLPTSASVVISIGDDAMLPWSANYCPAGL